MIRGFSRVLVVILSALIISFPVLGQEMKGNKVASQPGKEGQKVEARSHVRSAQKGSVKKAKKGPTKKARATKRKTGQSRSAHGKPMKRVPAKSTHKAPATK